MRYYSRSRSSSSPTRSRSLGYECTFSRGSTYSWLLRMAAGRCSFRRSVATLSGSIRFSVSFFEMKFYSFFSRTISRSRFWLTCPNLGRPASSSRSPSSS